MNSKPILHRTVARPYYAARDRLRMTFARFRIRDLERETVLLRGVLSLHEGVTVHHHHSRLWMYWPAVTPPRLSFEGPDRVARALQLYLDHCTATGALHYHWTLQGNWIDNAIRWHLRIGDLRLQGPLPWAWSLEKARTDLTRLTGWAYAHLNTSNAEPSVP